MKSYEKSSPVGGVLILLGIAIAVVLIYVGITGVIGGMLDEYPAIQSVQPVHLDPQEIADNPDHGQKVANVNLTQSEANDNNATADLKHDLGTSQKMGAFSEMISSIGSIGFLTLIGMAVAIFLGSLAKLFASGGI